MRRARTDKATGIIETARSALRAAEVRYGGCRIDSDYRMPERERYALFTESVRYENSDSISSLNRILERLRLRVGLGTRRDHIVRIDHELLRRASALL